LVNEISLYYEGRSKKHQKMERCVIVTLNIIKTIPYRVKFPQLCLCVLIQTHTRATSRTSVGEKAR